jgi:hypothetical protein
MRALGILSLGFTLAACGSSSAPANSVGPSVLITNTLVDTYVHVTWADASISPLFSDSIAPRTATRCLRFAVPRDSARWTIKATESGGGWTSSSSYWYKVGDRRAWEVLILESSPAGTPQIYAWDSASAVSGLVYGQTREIPPHC